MESEASNAERSGSPPVRKRPTSGEAVARRPKRGKYTAVACEECKKRKLKCNSSDGSTCQRCIDGGLSCVYVRGPSQASKHRADAIHQIQQVESLANEVSQLRHELSSLTEVVRELKDARPSSHRILQLSPGSQCNTQSPTNSQRESAPKQPNFVGPTRSAFGFMVGESSLTRMGIPACESLPPSGTQTPANGFREVTTVEEFWSKCTAEEIGKYVNIWQEEVEAVYPFIDIQVLASKAQHVLDFIRADQANGDPTEFVNAREVDLVKVAMSTGIILESHGRTELSSAIIDSVEQDISRISSADIDLGKVQLLTMLSIYYFHCDDELLAWRTIGVAARTALEMGLHRKDSLFDNFQDSEARQMATRAFWCVYVLDRRWSFGTSLSFALVDRDIDPELPEPGEKLSYLKCMVGYGRLCSKLWDAIPPFQSSPQYIPEHIVLDLDTSTQDWLESIPSHLRLRHPRLGLAPRAQPPILHRLRALLYLRGNHTRCLIHRHYLLSTANITRNLSKAWLVVDIAQDSIQVLMHLGATTNIYSRQQNAFNYFLLSSLAIIFLAVCHAPDVFAEPCRKSFLDAVELVRGFSRNSLVSRRLWKTIRGLLPRLKRLGIQRSEEAQNSQPTAQINSADAEGAPRTHTISIPESSGNPLNVMEESDVTLDNMDINDMMPELDFANSVPDISQIESDLVSLFDVFGTVHQQFPDDFVGCTYDSTEMGLLDGMGDEISRRFQGLI